jgi:putative ABC transport system substrate-binding protein
MALAAMRQAAWAQARPRVIAVLNGATAVGMKHDLVDALREGLASHGLVEGRDIELHFRFAEGEPDRLPALLDELLRLKPAVLVAAGVDDPVQMRIAESHARPGGNFTGISAAFQGVLARRMQVLSDIVPAPRRFAVLGNPVTVDAADLRQAMNRLEGQVGGPLLMLEARHARDLEAVFSAIARERINGLVVLTDATFYNIRHDIASRCAALKLPSVWGARGYLDAGGLASYQGDFYALFNRSAALVDKILKGTQPGDIPFEQGTKFELVLNLRAARELGLSIPARVRLAADTVIE